MPTGHYTRHAVEERFWENVDKSGECWIWTGSRRSGYGRFRVKDKALYAHRYSWVLAFGEIPDGMLVCHKCDRPPCVRPEHLFLGTRTDNLVDAIQKGRKVYGGDHNSHGEQHYRAKLTDEKVLEGLQRVANGEYQSDVAKSLDISASTFCSIVKGEIWKHIKRPLRSLAASCQSESNRRLRMSDDRVREVLRRAAGGESHTSIAKSLGVSQTLVSNIVRGVSWKHVPR